MSDEKKYEKFKEIMHKYQYDYQDDNPNNKLVKKNIQAYDNLSDFYDVFEEALTEAQDLGFVQGMQFATEMLSVTEKKVKNKEVMDKLFELVGQYNFSSDGK